MYNTYLLKKMSCYQITKNKYERIVWDCFKFCTYLHDYH